MRTIIELPNEHLDALDALRRREGISRAEVIRRAVAAYVRLDRATHPNAAFGLWRGRGVDALAEERRLRGEWEPRGRRR
jgi:hypothetical protein